MQTAFQIDRADNVATALTAIAPGAVRLLAQQAAHIQHARIDAGQLGADLGLIAILYLCS